MYPRTIKDSAQRNPSEWCTMFRTQPGESGLVVYSIKAVKLTFVALTAAVVVQDPTPKRSSRLCQIDPVLQDYECQSSVLFISVVLSPG